MVILAGLIKRCLFWTRALMSQMGIPKIRVWLSFRSLVVRILMSSHQMTVQMNRGLVFYTIRQHAWHRWMNLVLITMKDCLGDPPGAPGASTIIPFMSQSHVSILEIYTCTDRWLPSQGHGLIPPLLRSVYFNLILIHSCFFIIFLKYM